MPGSHKRPRRGIEALKRPERGRVGPRKGWEEVQKLEEAWKPQKARLERPRGPEKAGKRSGSHKRPRKRFRSLENPKESPEAQEEAQKPTKGPKQARGLEKAGKRSRRDQNRDPEMTRKRHKKEAPRP